jgi:hypothetical protein
MPRIELDPSLIGGGNGVNAFASAYQNALANSFKNKATQQELDVNQFKMDGLRQEQQDSNALRQLLGGQTQPTQAQMYSAGGVKKTQDYLKGQGDLAKVNADASKTTAETEKMQLEKHFRRLDLMGQLMGGVQDQGSYDQMRAQASKIPELADLVPNMPPTYDAKAIEIGRQKAMSVKDSMAARHQELTLAETGRHNVANEKISVQNNELTNKTSRENNQASVGATIRGQNMTDARSRESNSASMSKPFEVTGEDGKPVLVRQDRQGNISRVEGFAPKSGAEKPMTDAQSKAALFGSRMEQSDKIIQDLAKAGTNKSVPFSNAGFGVGNAVTALSSGSQQQLQQAKRDFINATLRRESGAVISPSEFDNAEKQYFPQIGDAESVIKQKANNRAIATRGVQAEIPKGQRGVVKDIIGGGGSDIDALLNKYK